MSPATAAQARHAHDYLAACDLLLSFSDRDYKGTHGYYGRHADEYCLFAEESTWAIRCIEADPLWPQGRHRVPGFAS